MNGWALVFILSFVLSPLLSKATTDDDPLALVQVAQDFQNKFQNDSAIAYHKKASEIFKRNEDWKNYAIALNDIAGCYNALQKFDDASNHLSLAEETHATHLEHNDSIAAIIGYNKGGLYWRTGEFALAIEALEAGLSRYKSAIATENILLADLHNLLGINYGEMGDRFNEIINMERSLEIVLQHPEAWEDTLVYIGDLAARYANIGTAYHNQGDCEKGLSYYQKALSLDRQVLGQKHAFIAQDYNLISSALSCLERYDEAIAYQRRSQQMYLEIYGEGHYKSGYGFNNMGLAYHGKKDYDSAVYNLNKAVSAMKKLYPDGNFRTADALFNLGKSHVLNGKPAEAQKFLLESISILEKTDPNNFRVAKAYDMIGWSYYHQTEYDQALESIQKALNWHTGKSEPVSTNPTSVSIGAPHLYRLALNHKSQTLLAQYRATEKLDVLHFALQTSELAIATLNNMLLTAKQEASRIEIVRQSIEVYEQAIRVASLLFNTTGDSIYSDKVFHFIEQSKAYILRQTFRDRTSQLIATIPDSIKFVERDFKRISSDLRNKIQQAEGNGDSEKAVQIRGELFDIHQEFEQHLASLQERFPKYYQNRYDDQVVTLNDLQEQLNDQEIFLNYFEGDSVLYTLIISNSQINVIDIPLSRSLQDNIDLFKRSIGDLQLLMVQPELADSIYLTSAYSLYQELLLPIKEHLLKRKRLIISPDGHLSQINFEAFLTEPSDRDQAIDYQSLPYLLNDHDISYANSATVYLQGLKKRDRAKSLFAGFAPQYELDYLANTDTSSYTLKQLVRSGDWKLEGARKEVVAISDILGGDRYLGQDATESSFKDASPSYQILHLAMHGVVNDYNQETELIFSEEEDNMNDGLLRLDEIYNLDLAAQMVVLGSCQSGTGQVKRGEGVMSVSRAFQYANCPSVVMSLWNIPDISTQEILVGFYKNLKGELPKDNALRQAKLSYLNSQQDPLYAHPYYWAGFILMGNPESLDTGGNNSQLLLLGLMIIIIAIFTQRKRLIKLF